MIKLNTKESSTINTIKIVTIYLIGSIIYVYASHFSLNKIATKTELLRFVQTDSDAAFILITSVLLYLLVNKNFNQIHLYYKKVNDLKQRSDDEFTDLFNYSPIPKWLFDIDTFQFLLVNKAACDKYGYTNDEFLSMTVRDIRPKECLDDLDKVIALALEDGSYPFEVITLHQKKNGEVVQVKIEAKYVYYKGKKVKLAYAIDLTNELNNRKKLEETNYKLQRASEIALLGHFTVNLTNSEIQWSEQSYKIFEVDPATFELTAENINNCFHPDDRFDFNPNYVSNFDKGNILEKERRIITSSGSVKWVIDRQYLIKDEDNNPIQLDGILIDITKRKQIEKEILESNERFNMITKATIEAVLDWDITNDIVNWGEGFHTIFGYDLNNYDNYLWSKNIHPDDREYVLDELNKIIIDPTKEYFNAEYRFLKANGDIAFVKHKGIFIRDDSGKAIREVAAMIDLTETLENVRKIENQNNALSDIAWIQSHTVRSPLTNLMGLVNLLKSEITAGETSESEKTIHYLLDTAEKLDTILKDIVGKTRK